MNHINNIAELITELNDRRIEALKARDKPAEAAYSYFLSIVKKAEKDGGQYQEALNALKKEEKALKSCKVSLEPKRKRIRQSLNYIFFLSICRR